MQNVLIQQAPAASGGASGFDAGTLMLFQQTAAPTGWTKETTHNDKALRVVSGTASSGGTSAFSTVFGKTATDNFTLTSSQIPAHAHPLSGGTSFVGTSTARAQMLTQTDTSVTASAGNSVGNTGSGGAHAHGMDIRVQYVDVIIASKD